MVAAPMSTPLSEDGDGVAIIIERHARITDGGSMLRGLRRRHTGPSQWKNHSKIKQNLKSY